MYPLVEDVYVQICVFLFTLLVKCVSSSDHVGLLSIVLYALIWVFGLMSGDYRNQGKATAHQYHCSLLWCNES